MPKKIDPKVKERCLQQMLEHASEYPNPTAAAEVVAKRNGPRARQADPRREQPLRLGRSQGPEAPHPAPPR